MPALVPTDHTGTIVWLGRQPGPVVDLVIRAEPATDLPLGFAGPAGESHAGLTRPSCSRVTAQYPKGTEIRNVRQLCIVSAEDLALIAAGMGLPALNPAWVGANVVVQGIPDFTHVPPSSRLQAEGGATVVVDMENLPCQEPAVTMDRAGVAQAKAFKAAAQDRRGVTAWVEREGTLRLGERIRLHVPAQRPWAP